MEKINVIIDEEKKKENNQYPLPLSILNKVQNSYENWQKIRDEKIEKFLFSKIDERSDEWDTLPTYIAKEYAKNVIAVLKSSEVETYRPDLIEYFRKEVEKYTADKVFQYGKQKYG